MKRTLLYLALCFVLTACTSKDEQAASQPAGESPTEAAPAAVAPAPKAPTKTEATRLDEAFHTLLPRDTHVFAYIPSLVGRNCTFFLHAVNIIRDPCNCFSLRRIQ